ncbi:uncharacterized protein DUF2490 [Maribacter vaceletii]|uniref:Uncharacterized protein DUF2490 n=1 Tax=Maribacter vaceletii TaxID=1206816 RepID=A0A495DTQ9_9FLAO|nr:DUF2490 domain-containing protein [Maribacter vaceletii]RKR08041.1 uncharacterized protein DUF2490 [Maribacter vaceletii]
MIKFRKRADYNRLNKTFKKGVTILLLLVSFFNYAQDQEDLLGSWFILSGSNKISNKFSIPTLSILRHYKLISNYEFAFFRTGLTYAVKKNFLTTVGVAYLDSEAYIGNEFGGHTKQFWVYEELVFKSKYKNTLISNRIRLESRWIDKVGENLVNNRIRYRLQAKIPLENSFYFKISNEYFVNLKAPHFNQNRFFIGLGYNLTKSVKVDVGYMKNTFKKSNYDRIQLAVYFKTDFRKNK